jgi:5-methylcytosine-specific restriction endonuclease McrA
VGYLYEFDSRTGDQMKKKIDHSYLLRKWTLEEKKLVLDFYYNKDIKSPASISKLTGFPINQIRFWIYGPRGSKPSKRPLKNAANNSLKAYYRQKETDWLGWKTHCIRSSSMRLAKKHNREAPSIQDIETWLKSCLFKCGYCSCDLDMKTFGIDHAIPVSRGGSLLINNLKECCRNCNLIKGSLNPQEFNSLITLIHSFDDGGASIKARLKRGFISSA